MASKAVQKQGENRMKSDWHVYILRTAAGMLYTGITTDVDRRLAEHAGAGKGARSLRGKGPLELVYRLPARDRSEASRLEARIKKLSRADKLRLIADDRAILDLINP